MMKLSYPTLPTCQVVQAWGNYDPVHYAVGYHMGTDIAGLTGSGIFAVCDGMVEIVSVIGEHGYGRFVVIKHDDGRFYSLYAHLLNDIRVKVGDAVLSGQTIGRMGGDPNDADKMDGYSTGPHLHFEIYLRGQPVGIKSLKTAMGYTVDPFPFVMSLYAPAPIGVAKVVSDRGVRVRTAPRVTAINAITSIGKYTVFQVAEITQVGNDKWVRHWSIRPEWSAAVYGGDELIEISTDVFDTPVPPPAQDCNSLVRAGRRDELQQLLENIEIRMDQLL